MSLFGSFPFWSPTHFPEIICPRNSSKKISKTSNLKSQKPQKKPLIIRETGTLKRLLIFQEMEFFSPPQENFLYFRKWKPPPKKLIFSHKKAFHVFREPPKKFHIFQETKLSYISRIRNPKKFLIFQEVTLGAQKVKSFLYFGRHNFLVSSLKKLKKPTLV